MKPHAESDEDIAANTSYFGKLLSCLLGVITLLQINTKRSMWVIYQFGDHTCQNQRKMMHGETNMYMIKCCNALTLRINSWKWNQEAISIMHIFQI